MNLKLVQKRMRQASARLLRQGTPVTLHYEAPDSGASVADRGWMEEEAPPSLPTRRKVVRAFVHSISPQSVVQRGYTQLRAGDVIIDFPHSLDLSRYRNVSFEIDGDRYSQADAGEELAQHWDAMVGDGKIFNTILVRPIG